MIISSSSDALYQSCYCEENVYKLLEKIENRSDFYAVFISNQTKIIPLWKQKSATNPSGFVLWDYHVIAISKSTSEDKKTKSKVYDLDSSLDWGIDFLEYWEETMRMNQMEQYQSMYRRKFRIIPANEFMTLFSSDRSHMLGSDGNYLKPPPSWPIINPQIPSNLMRIIDFNENFENTIVMDENEMFNYFS